MNERRRFAPVVVLVLFGLMSLTSVLTRPRVAAYYPPDIVAVFGSGLCFGAAIMGLVTRIRARRSE